MKSNIIIWSLGFALLESSCSAGPAGNATTPNPDKHHITRAVGHEKKKPTADDINRHEFRKEEKESKRERKAPEHVDVANKPDVVNKPDLVDKPDVVKKPDVVNKPDAVNLPDIVKTSDVLVETNDNVNVNCAFANPTLEQAEELFKLGLFDTFKAAIEYAELINVPFSRAVGKWFAKNITMEGLYDEGFAMGDIHRVWFNTTVPSGNRTGVICKMESALYTQMKDTCHFKEWENDLITVSVALMEGYAHAVDHASFEGCV